MSNPVLFSMLWPANQHVCVELATRYGFDIAAMPGALTAEQVGAIQSAGRRHIALQPAAFGVDQKNIETEAATRFSNVASTIPQHLAAIAPGDTGSRIASAMLRAISRQITGTVYLATLLDALRERETVAGLVLNESDMPLGKTAAMWGKLHGVPSFVLSHGAGVGEAYTVTSEVVADYLLLAGERSTEPFADVGFPRERMLVCGNPAWDSTPALLSRRNDLRAQVRSSIGVSPETPIVVFGTTWNAKLTALRDTQIFQQSVAAFFRGCRALQDLGVHFYAVVKDRPPNAEFGKAECQRLAHEAGFESYSYATGDMMTMLFGADLFVGHDTSAFVEAAIAGVPSVNIWVPSAWLVGPAFDRNDGVHMVEHSNAAELANTMAVLLKDESARARAVDGAAQQLPRFVLRLDGRSGQRCAEAIAQRVSSRPALVNDGRALWQFVTEEPRVVLDIGGETSKASDMLRKKYPSARFVAISPDHFQSQAHTVSGVDLVILDDQLERMYDPWGFLVSLKAVLDPRAKVLASVPNARNITFLSEIIRGELHYVQGGQRDFGRLRFFTRKTIAELFEQTGYAISQMQRVYDANVRVPSVPANASFDLDAGAYALKGVTASDLDDLRTLEYLVDATPV